MYFLYECGLFYENVTHLVRLWLNYVHKYHLCSWCWQKNIAICEIWVKLHWYCFWECQRAVLFVIVWYCYFSYLYICICLVWKEASKYCLVCFGYQKVHFCPGLNDSSEKVIETCLLCKIRFKDDIYRDVVCWQLSDGRTRGRCDCDTSRDVTGVGWHLSIENWNFVV